MPPFEECSCKFMLDVLAGDKKVLDISEVTEFNVPRYSEFTLQSILDEVKNDPEVMSYLPELTAKNKKHSRKYLLTILSSLKPHYIKVLVTNANAERVKTSNLPAGAKPLSITPEYRSLIANTTFVSCKLKTFCFDLFVLTATKRGKLLRGLTKTIEKKERRKPIKRNIQGTLAEYEEWKRTK